MSPAGLLYFFSGIIGTKLWKILLNTFEDYARSRPILQIMHAIYRVVDTQTKNNS